MELQLSCDSKTLCPKLLAVIFHEVLHDGVCNMIVDHCRYVMFINILALFHEEN